MKIVVQTEASVETQLLAWDVVIAHAKREACGCSCFEHFGTCRHVESLALEAMPAEPFPSPEQLAAEAGVEDPFKGVVL